MSEKGGASLSGHERRLCSYRCGRRPSSQSRSHTSLVAATRANALVDQLHRRRVTCVLIIRLGAEIARRWLLAHVWRIEAVNLSDEEKAKEIIRRYADKTFSYTDATSFAVMERLNVRSAFGFDPHFRQYGLVLLV